MSEILSERTTVEENTSQELAEYILRQADKIKEAEREIELANNILMQRGTTIDEQLDLMRNETNTFSA